MQHARKEDQTADAFSLPKELLVKVKARAAAMGMTKSGFYRYSLAKELGHDEKTARGYAAHRAVLNSIESAFVLNDASSKKVSAATETIVKSYSKSEKSPKRRKPSGV